MKVRMDQLLDFLPVSGHSFENVARDFQERPQLRLFRFVDGFIVTG